MPGIRGRVERLRATLGPEPTSEFAIVSIGLPVPGRPPSPPVVWYEAPFIGWVGCPIPGPTRELAEELVRLNALGCFSVEMEAGAGEVSNRWAGLRRQVLASAVDDRQRRTLDATPVWDVVWDPVEMEEWPGRRSTRDQP